MLVERHRALLIAEDPAHASVDAVLAELGDRLERRNHDVLRIRGRDEQPTGSAERALARHRLLALPHEAGHARDHQREQNRRRADDEQQIPVAGRDDLDDLQRRGDQGRAGEQRQSQPRQPRLAIGLHVGELLHRGMERGRPPEQVEEDPARIEPQLVVVGVVQREQAVDVVGDQHRHDPGDQQVERRPALAAVHGEADPRGEQDDVAHRVADRDELGQQAEGPSWT